MAQLGGTQYSSVSWTAGDVITEAKLDNMVANDQAYDSHAAQGILLNNLKGLCSKDSGGVNRDLLYVAADDDIQFGDTNLGDVDVQNKLLLGDSMPSTNVRCRVYRGTSNQTIGDSSWTKIEFNAESYDSGNDFDSSTDYDFTPPVDGYYSIKAQSLISGPGAGTLVGLRIFDGTTNKATTYISGQGTNDQSIVLATDLYLTTTDVIYFQLFQDSGGNLDIIDNEWFSYASIHLLST